MNRDYASFEDAIYIEHHNRPDLIRNKRIGDAAEELVANYYRNLGCEVRVSSAKEDARGTDLFIDGKRYNVKNFAEFRLQLQNDYGNPGWLFTYPKKGIHRVLMLLQHDLHTMYVFDPRDMMNWWFKNREFSAKDNPLHTPRNKCTKYWRHDDTGKSGRTYTLTNADLSSLISSGTIRVINI